MVNEGLKAAEEKMRDAGVPDAAIATFAHYYEQLESGETGMLADADLDQLSDVPDYDSLPDDADREALDKAVIVKLNGGLGTSMGMEQAKSLLEVKKGKTFLDVIAGQVLELRRAHDARLPLVLMNSFYTRDDTLEALAKHPELESDLPADFVQNKEPKITVEDRFPIEWPDDPDLEWCPPGHGDVYTALKTSGTLDALLEHGYEYAFISNSDNLGAVLDPRVLSWFAAEALPFVMEVCEKTPADRKGGHPAVLRETGRLVLRETAQTPEEDLERFGDIDTWKYFNTNNLWVSLRALAQVLEDNDGVLGLPMIVNKKTVDPGDKSTPEVFQLETAMGAAVGVFEGAQDAGRAAAPVRAGQDDQRPADPALRRLRADRRLPRRAVTGPERRAAARRPRLRSLQAPARLRRALPGRPAVAGGRAQARGRGRREVRPRRRRARRGVGPQRRRRPARHRRRDGPGGIESARAAGHQGSCGREPGAHGARRHAAHPPPRSRSCGSSARRATARRAR